MPKGGRAGCNLLVSDKLYYENELQKLQEWRGKNMAVMVLGCFLVAVFSDLLMIIACPSLRSFVMCPMLRIMTSSKK